MQVGGGPQNDEIIDVLGEAMLSRHVYHNLHSYFGILNSLSVDKW